MTFIGQSTRRFEDHRFLTGRATFVEDVNVAGQAWAFVVRSPYAHAGISNLDTLAARATPGVLGVFTYADITHLGLLPCATQVATVEPCACHPVRLWRIAVCGMSAIRSLSSLPKPSMRHATQRSG